MKRLRIFDTTLRDGDQMPGVRLSRAHKLEIAKQLDRLGVDVIEAGFPASSDGDFRAVQDISAAMKNTAVAALARTSEQDIRLAAKALEPAAKPIIHVFVATSELHMTQKLKMTREQVIEHIRTSVALAVSLCPTVEFSAEDASRSDRDFLCLALQTAIDAGASVVNIPDTVGYSQPDEFGELVAYAAHTLKLPDNGCISVHCHNDLGLAVANSLAALQNGATQIECTVNGVGERAGNASLEEIVMATVTRPAIYDAETSVDTSMLTRTSKLVASLFGVAVPPNKPIVGANAFAHEAGIHQHGVMCDRRTYEIMTPESVGVDSSRLVLGRLSGRHAFGARLAELGYTLDAQSVDDCFARFKQMAEKKDICDDDIMALVNEYLDNLSSVYELDTFQIQSGNRTRSMAMVTLACRGVSVSEAALGDGPIDAAFNAISRLSGADGMVLEEYRIKAVTEGADALGEAFVRVSINGARYSGRSVSTDIIEASLKAYVNALNKWAAGSSPA